jgi:ATP-binding cassette subfamily B protein/subfamily B ATP-binding cassette protein MsbA
MKILVDNVFGQAAMPEPLARGVRLLPGSTSPTGLLAWVVAAGVAVFVVNSLIDILLTRTWIRVGERMVYNLAGDLFARLQRRSLLFHHRNPVGDSLSRVTGDSWSVYKLVDALLFTPTVAAVMLVGVVGLMLAVDPVLTLMTLAVTPFMAASSILLRRPQRAAVRVRREIESRIESHVQRTLSGLKIVQAFAQEEAERDRLVELGRMAVRAQRRSTLIGSLGTLAAGLFAVLGTGAVLWVGARHVAQGSLSLGSLLVFLAYLAPLKAHLNTFTGLYGTLQEIGVATERVQEVLGTQPEVAERPGALALRKASGQVRLEHITFGYEPGRPVLRGVSLEAHPGQVVALIGPTGAGKTTLVSLVPRFFDPWQGRVLLDGHDVRDLRLHSLRAQVAVVWQEPWLFPLSIAQNIAYGRPSASREAIEAAARAARLDQFIEQLPQGYDTVVGERGATLSGGERQRLSIARALLTEAPVLILDEPTSALDAQTESLLLQALAQLMRGRTTLVIAHRLSTIRHADHIIVLDHGQIAESGSHANLLARGGLYSRLHELQSKPSVSVPAEAGL